LIYELSFKTSPEMLFLKDVLLDDRNMNWVTYLQKNIYAKSYFVAVGAAHISGEFGMVELHLTV
jgi:uncharacterized protein YbaP (TraB family)